MNRFLIQLYDFQSGRPIGKPIETAQPYSFNTGDVYMFDRQRGAPINRISHLILSNGTDMAFWTMVYVGRPGAAFNDTAPSFPDDAALAGAHPVPWPWTNE